LHQIILQKIRVCSSIRGSKNSHKEAQRGTKKNYFAPNHFAKKLVMIRADQWLKISHEEAQEAQREN
jgi:hypothetical protein